MICLDSNYLILGATEGTKESDRIYTWLMHGEQILTASVCWYEFQCGPVSDSQLDFMRSFLSDIRPFTELEAEVAARLFEHAERKRSLKTDAMIAATALVSRAKLATNNTQDFRKFPELQLV